ncbi:hypothetical protein [Archangium violaceum]|uniref:Uncharacterized protein n=1 Tax=Archangium violaceum Cb vi76 TaxID=1406225 RepID=A0A084SPP1_9BACT|nr:hypothetical protein [Archangium violaceum]KFA90426.1 hypothetical protein Q664_28725 [Archangium violaceum Cb vi76]
MTTSVSFGSAVHASLLAVLLLSACAPVHESLGDRALSRGDEPGAIAEYEKAMKGEILVDFEYERLREKRTALVEGRWGPMLDAELARRDAMPPLAHVTALLRLREQVRSDRITRAFLRRLDAATVDATLPERLAATTSPEVSERTRVLLSLVDLALAQHAPQRAVEQLVTALERTLAVGFPPVGAERSLARIEELFALRTRLRERKLPASVDALLDADFRRLAPGPLPPPGPDAAAWLERVLSLREQGQRLAAPAETLALLQRTADAALARLMEEPERDVQAHRWLAAVDRLSPLAARVEEGHPVRERLRSVLQQGVAWHQEQARQLPPGYRRSLHLALAATLSGAQEPRRQLGAELQALGDGWRTALTLQPSFSTAPSCSSAAEVLARSLSRGSREVRVGIVLSRCAASESQGGETREVAYQTQQSYQEEVVVQAGYRTERVQVGSHKEQCSKPASIDGYVWRGLCDVPDYETRNIPLYETRLVDKVREVTGRLSYPVRKWRATAEVSGVATLRWEDGTELRVPFTRRREDVTEAWAYRLPPRELGQRERTGQQDFTPGFGATRTLVSAASEAAGELSASLAREVRAHRARLARAEGAAALAAGNEDVAAEAFVRSVLHDGRAEAQAAAWFERTQGLSAATVERVLSLEGVARAVPAADAPERPLAYAPPGLVVPVDSVLLARTSGLETDVSNLREYKDGVKPGFEGMRTHFKLAGFNLGTRGTSLERPAMLVGVECFGPILANWLGRPGWGFTVQDELGLHAGVGAFLGKQAAYAEGEEEGRLALRLGARYTGLVGLRLRSLGLFVGADTGYTWVRSGDVFAGNLHVSPAARVALRFWGPYQLIVQGWGFVQPLPGLPRQDGLSVSFPVLGRGGADLMFQYERATFDRSALLEDGKTRTRLGQVPVETMMVLLGIRG